MNKTNLKKTKIHKNIMFIFLLDIHIVNHTVSSFQLAIIYLNVMGGMGYCNIRKKISVHCILFIGYYLTPSLSS